MDVTAAVGTCANCGRTGPMASLHLHGRGGPGWVARCSGCDQVMLRLVRATDAARLDLRGMRALRLPVPVVA